MVKKAKYGKGMKCIVIKIYFVVYKIAAQKIKLLSKHTVDRRTDRQSV